MPRSHSASPRSSSARDRSQQRGYVACLGCRTRKVRCVLGHKPPCAKCAREHRECVFETHKKTVKRREAPKWVQPSSDAPASAARSGTVGHDDQDQDSERRGDESEIRVADSENSPDVPFQEPSPSEQEQEHAPRLKHASTHRPAGPDTGPSPGPGPGSVTGDASLADRVMSSILVRPSDALDVLFDAAHPQHPPAQWPTPGLVSLVTPVSTSTPATNLVTESGLVPVAGLSQPRDDVLDLWDKCRFVRQGWFTAQEAVTYLDLFHQHLASFSPALTEDFQSHVNHRRLIAEEPLLCCTLLMISSRFFILPGAGGVSRSHFIHNRLWQYCENLISRLMFGQEKHSTAKIRVVGSIESLILISDWHPRSVHFPPHTEGWDSELISPGYDRQNRVQTDADVPLIRWREDVFEPAKRSERMSWMLLGAAVSLAFELGVFADPTTESSSSQHSARIARAKKLLYVHVTQMAVKMGCSSLLPENASFSVPAAATAIDADGGRGKYLALWADLVQLMKTASALFFQSRQAIQQQLSTGQYAILLRHFAPSMIRWREELSAAAAAEIPSPLKSLLLVEYHYLKTCTNALAIQAVVERAIARQVARLGEGLDSCMLPQDQKLIHEVISDSATVLEVAISMASERRLRYAPLRTLVCITSSSIYLLKAISLGARTADLQSSLQTLDRCIDALRGSGTDDMDFSVRYATLIEKHVAKFRANFTLPKHPLHTVTNQDESMLPPGHHQPQYPASDWTMSFDMFDTSQHTMSDEWWARPFDPNIAPFSTQGENISLGLELDALDFLWNLPPSA